MTQLPIRPGTAEDLPAIVALMGAAFHETMDQEWEDLERQVFEPDRSLVIYDPDRGSGPLVAHAAAFTRDLTVPGGTVPAAHVSMVSVLSTHRRRGLLTRLMHQQLPQLPEPVAVLWASEGRIYPRFGYGLASQKVGLSADTREVSLPAPAAPGRLRTIPPAEARPELERLYESVRPDRPGWSSRNDGWWSYRLADLTSNRHGATERRATLHYTDAGQLGGYALWRAKPDWQGTGPRGEVQVTEVVTADADSYLALWRFLFSLDLTRTVTLRLAGLDEPLLRLADEPRRLGATLGDGLFVRIVDLPAALTARRYAAPLDLVLEVTDPLLPGNAGRWRLTATGSPGSQDKPTCTRVTDPPDLTVDIADLAAAYLGDAGALATLAAGGRVRAAQPDALAAASIGFGWHRPPAGIEVF